MRERATFWSLVGSQLGRINDYRFSSFITSNVTHGDSIDTFSDSSFSGCSLDFLYVDVGYISEYAHLVPCAWCLSLSDELSIYFKIFFHCYNHELASVWLAATLCSAILCLPNEDFGRPNELLGTSFRSTFPGCEYSIRATPIRKYIPNSSFGLPKSSFGEHKLTYRIKWKINILQSQLDKLNADMLNIMFVLFINMEIYNLDCNIATMIIGTDDANHVHRVRKK